MALDEREKSLIQIVGEVFKEELERRDKSHEDSLSACRDRITKLEGEVEGLISLLGEK